jgi:hypothetical protein
MAKLSESVERERAAFLTCFRGEAGLVYSPTPGGEGRFVSEDEAVAFICEFAEMAQRHGRRFRYSVWASAPLMVFFLFLATLFHAPLLAAIAWLSLLGWFFTAVVQRIQRARFKWRIWARLERRPPVRALSRPEKIARGYALTVGQWAGLALMMAISFALQAPPSAIPPEWRDVQSLSIAILCLVAFVALLVFGLARLLRWLQKRA